MNKWNQVIMKKDRSKLNTLERYERKKTDTLKKRYWMYKEVRMVGDYKHNGFFLSTQIGSNMPYYRPYYSMEVGFGSDAADDRNVPVYVAILYWDLAQRKTVELFATYITPLAIKNARTILHGLRHTEILNQGISLDTAKRLILDILGEYPILFEKFI